MKKKERNRLKDILKKIRSGVRLRTKIPQVFRDKSKYTRKDKHRSDYRDP